MNIIIESYQAPGDILVLTTILRDLKLQNPNFNIYIKSHYPEIFENNPYITKEINKFNSEVKRITNDDIILSRNGSHYSTIINMIISDWLGKEIEQTSIYPELYLTEEEKSDSLLQKLGINKPFWIMNSSFKSDIPLKQWSPQYWTQIIRELNKRNIKLVQTGSIYDISEEYPGVKSVIGKTEELRDFLSLCYHAEGFITHVSFLVHIAAALNKPCIVLAGNREHPWYSCYPTQQILHIHGKGGLLECSNNGNGCWNKERQQCKNLIGQPSYPLCLQLIIPEEILLNVLKYENNVIH